MGDNNRKHWDALGARYSENWASHSQRLLSEQETSFVIRHVPPEMEQAVLDVGVGNGRILEKLLSDDRTMTVYGVDLSAQMVEFCRAKFGDNSKLVSIAVCDVANQLLPVPSDLNFVSAIRVLKYSKNWWDIVEKLLGHLAPGGVLVFSMPNARSVKRLSRPYAVEYFTTTVGALQELIHRSNAEILEITGFSKLPDVIYRASRSSALASSLLRIERGLDRVMGSQTLSRELFVAVRRKA